MKCWYAVHTKPHCEVSACTNLDRLGVEVFLPMLRERKLRNGKCYPTSSPLFPRYLFANFDVPNHLRAVTYARGVRSIVTFGGGPCVVDESIIHTIRSQATDGVIELPADRFSPGQIVRIQDGPLCGLEAVFEKKIGWDQSSGSASEGHVLSGASDFRVSARCESVNFLVAWASAC